MTPPKPESSEARTGLLHYIRHFRRDLLSALPARLYRAWMAEFRAGPIHSFLCNDPDLVNLVLRERPGDFPKSDRLREGLAPLLGRSVFVTNGEEWQHQRRIIDPAFEGGRLREIFPQMADAARAAARRMPQGEVDIEPLTSHAAADVIFRTLFSIPIEDETAAQVFAAFRDHQQAQPIVNIGALLPLPGWFPRFHSRRATTTAARIRGLIETLVDTRAREIEAGNAPDDLATKIMTTPDPQTGKCFSRSEMVDQVAIFFLAGHETSASALAWASWLLAAHPDWQERLAAEALTLSDTPSFSDISELKLSRAVFRETLRLYPPVPMMVRETTRAEKFRDRNVPKGAQIVLSPWHLHRHERLWDNPDGFDPARWETPNGKACQRNAFIPFSAGARVCPGAGFAMVEGPLILSMILRDHRLEVTEPAPVPAARLTVRGQDGIRVRISPRAPASSFRP
ncbi:cytochrome P450 [Paracoccus aurantiacus]|uniref:Cytochrome P450 n=1 Tax=Paracoccus aurantiacus TaxID=2599412 RepID=A0A5C6S7R3_9RHOB|nr:cytochrome P450 [Paracoccus aurantiacus]TXB70486.1 cytochrome P450 [Paracoccus aurantiacus]